METLTCDERLCLKRQEHCCSKALRIIDAQKEHIAELRRERDEALAQRAEWAEALNGPNGFRHRLTAANALLERALPVCNSNEYSAQLGRDISAHLSGQPAAPDYRTVRVTPECMQTPQRFTMVTDQPAAPDPRDAEIARLEKERGEWAGRAGWNAGGEELLKAEVARLTEERLTIERVWRAAEQKLAEAEQKARARELAAALEEGIAKSDEEIHALALARQIIDAHNGNVAKLAAASALLHELDAAAELMPSPEQLRADKRICIDAKRILAGLIEARLAHLAGATPPRAEPECTGVAATWYPVHGDCSCPRQANGERTLDSDACALHSSKSSHAEQSAAPDPRDAEIARLIKALRDTRYQPDAPDPRDAEVARLGSALDQVTDAFRKSTDEWNGRAQQDRAEVARLKEALAAADHRRAQALRLCDEREAALKAADQKLAEAERDLRQQEAERVDAIGAAANAEARVRELEAELAQLKALGS